MNNFFREGIVTRIIASEKSWIEGEAIQQLNKTATLPGMYMAVGMPDLHPGKGHPIGAAFVTKNLIYPALVGNDIGCGMGLWQTDIALKKLKIERWLKKLDDMEGKWNGNISEWKQNQGLLVSNDDNSNYDYALGTIGGGNHFAELQKIHSIIDPQKFNNLNLNHNNAFLLVHSGSRGLGESILRTHLDLHGHEGISSESKEAELYLDQHHYALTWAKANRALIAERFLSILGRKGQNILDICHNAVLPIMMNNTLWWIHRKGATPSTQGIVMIPGSRGTLSYLVEPIGEQLLNAYSLAHGAGRKWKRTDAKHRLSQRFKPDDLRRTKLGSWVKCDDNQLIYEEAPQAYKDIDQVIADMLEAGIIKVIATFSPLLTYKTGGKQ